MISSTHNRTVRLLNASSLAVSGCLLMLAAGCGSSHSTNPLSTLVKETGPARPAPTTSVATTAPVTETASGNAPVVQPTTGPTATPPTPVASTTVTPPPAPAKPVRHSESARRRVLTEMGADLSKHDPVQPNPPPDAAILARNWVPVTSHYPSGATVAYPNYTYDKNLLPPALKTDNAQALMDPVLLIGDTVLTPVWMVFVPPWKEVVYRGVSYGPTQTGAAPLPPQ